MDIGPKVKASLSWESLWTCLQFCFSSSVAGCDGGDGASRGMKNRSPEIVEPRIVESFSEGSYSSFSIGRLIICLDGAANGTKQGGVAMGDPHIVDSIGEPSCSSSGDGSCLASICS